MHSPAVILFFKILAPLLGLILFLKTLKFKDRLSSLITMLLLLIVLTGLLNTPAINWVTLLIFPITLIMTFCYPYFRKKSHITEEVCISATGLFLFTGFVLDLTLNATGQMAWLAIFPSGVVVMCYIILLMHYRFRFKPALGFMTILAFNSAFTILGLIFP
jgi:hypothetical protein